MKFTHYRNLNRTEKYVTNIKQIKSKFMKNEDLKISYGLGRQFKFDSRCRNKPVIKGTVVASVSCNRDRAIQFSLYPISQNAYPEKAYEEFNNVVLPDIKKWIDEQISKPETAILGVEELIVEWNKKNHLFHNVRFL
jgi:hypothetical protein